MAKQKESAIVNRIKEHMTRGGYFVLKIHGGPYQQAGIPDILALRDGKALWVEVKQPGEKTTDLQNYMIGKLRAAGCEVIVATSIADLP